jgi:aminoglycoside phosphotransferase family enzyme/predicted kinase
MPLPPVPSIALPGAAVGPLDLERQGDLVRALQRELGRSGDGPASLLETHISYVLVCGERAYKVKKALRTSFLDQSTLARRLHACDEELRLNRRLAPDLYLGLVPITGPADQPHLAGPGRAIEWAVMMRAFAQQDLWDARAVRQDLHAAQIDELLQVLVPFHAAAAVAPPRGRLGSPSQVRAPLEDSLVDLVRLLVAPGAAASLHRLFEWELDAGRRLEPVMARRLADGRVRECHGDLHLGNVTTIAGHATVFDGIEFNDDFRWIDVASEVAFMAMDLHAHGLPGLAHRFVNGYLEASGDYDAVQVLDYYLVHRALIRAKVALLRAQQCGAQPEGADEADRQRDAAGRYLALALRFSRLDPAPTPPRLLLTHGWSGSGKSTAAQQRVESTGAIRIRADVERKRLAGLQPPDPAAAGPQPDLYSAAMTAATYERLNQLAVPVLRGGYTAVLDATFLRLAQRQAARAVAAAQGVACRILHLEVDADVARQRLRARAAVGQDPSDADERVLEAQIRSAEPLQADERDIVEADMPPGDVGR